MTKQKNRPVLVKKSISAAQRKSDPHAGPGESFPEDAAHIKAAWDLAGHAANPSAVRAKVLAYAKAHGLLQHLPADAQARAKGEAKGAGGMEKKARNSDMSAMVAAGFHATMPNSYERAQFLHEAHSRGLTHHLPADAHTALHANGIPHNHPNMQDGIVIRSGPHHENEGDVQLDPDDPAYPLMHEHVIAKAFSPKAFAGSILKSFLSDEGTVIEGWMSTPDRDLERDITEPEAFAGGPLQHYFARNAPLSMEHKTDTLPVGHLQHAAILRDGKLVEEALHPSDPAIFSFLPTSGSGVWVRGVITEEPAASAVLKGNIGGMSFIGNATRYAPLPGGGRRLLSINPLIESTVAAYPVNPKAAFQRVQKALGLSDQETAMEDEFDFDAFMAQAAQRADEKRAEEAKADAAAAGVQKGITAEQLGDVLAQFEKRLLTKFDEQVQEVQKAIPTRGEGVGRKAPTAPAENPLEADPMNYLIAKANSDEELSQQEKDLIGRIWHDVLADGMISGD